MTVKEYAENLLKECGCKLDCYRDDYNNAFNDMEEYRTEHNVPFSSEDVAKALVEIGNAQPIIVKPHAKYMLMWDNGGACDGYELDGYETEEAVKGAIADTYIEWANEESFDWSFENHIPVPTKEQQENWDYMIYECFCYAVCLQEDGTYGDMDSDDTIFLSDKELENIGWVEWENVKL
jgi:hypothetical protein